MRRLIPMKFRTDIIQNCCCRQRSGSKGCRTRECNQEVLMIDGNIWDRRGDCFKWLMNDENPRIDTEEGVANQRMTNKICEEKVHEALGGTKCRKAIWTDTIPAKEWTCIGKYGVQLLCRLLNSVVKTEKNRGEA